MSRVVRRELEARAMITVEALHHAPTPRWLVENMIGKTLANLSAGGQSWAYELEQIHWSHLVVSTEYVFPHDAVKISATVPARVIEYTHAEQVARAVNAALHFAINQLDRVAHEIGAPQTLAS